MVTKIFYNEVNAIKNDRYNLPATVKADVKGNAALQRATAMNSLQGADVIRKTTAVRMTIISLRDVLTSHFSMQAPVLNAILDNAKVAGFIKDDTAAAKLYTDLSLGRVMIVIREYDNAVILEEDDFSPSRRITEHDIVELWLSGMDSNTTVYYVKGDRENDIDTIRIASFKLPDSVASIAQLQGVNIINKL